jgi:hypothetical protein
MPNRHQTQYRGPYKRCLGDRHSPLAAITQTPRCRPGTSRRGNMATRAETARIRVSPWTNLACECLNATKAGEDTCGDHTRDDRIVRNSEG